jgi:16S rRNA (cytosine1402-N4)-methyltransferase
MTRHIPVLPAETIAALALKSGDSAIDATLGDAGHAEAILRATAPNGKLLGIDADPEAILRAKQFLYEFGERVRFVRDSFGNLSDIALRESFGPVRGILMDLGWSTPQFEERGRGFSFRKDEPLDMRYGAGGGRTAAELIAAADTDELEKIFREYGEEKFAKDIARAITEARRGSPIERTGQFTEIILSVYRKKLRSAKEVPWAGGLHPATKVFQALRIAVNDELGVLERALPQAVDALAPGGRLAVITFHSLEDRIVKHFFKKYEGKTLRGVTKKPVICGTAEYDANPRARSAKLRVIEKL